MNNGKSSPFIGCSQLYPKHYVSLTDYPIASDIKPTAHRILSLTHRKCWGKPNIRILPPLLQILTYHLPLQQEIWLVFNSTSNLIGVTYIHLWSTDPPVHNIPDAPTKRYFFYKKTTKKRLSRVLVSKFGIRCRMNLKHQKISLKKQVKIYLSKILR